LGGFTPLDWAKAESLHGLKLTLEPSEVRRVLVVQH